MPQKSFWQAVELAESRSKSKMDLHRFRAQQESFSSRPSKSPGPSLSTNPDGSVNGSHTATSTTRLIYQPNPILPKGILKSVPWGKEHQHPNPFIYSSHPDISSPITSPTHSGYLLSPRSPPPIPTGSEYLDPGFLSSPRSPPPLPIGYTGPGYARRSFGGAGGGGGRNSLSGYGGFTFVKSGGRKTTPYRGFAYTPTRPSTGRLSRLTGVTDVEGRGDCGWVCWGMFLVSCVVIWGLGGMWLL